MLEQSSGASSYTQSTRRERAAEQRRISPLTAIIYTESRVSLHSLCNAKNHSFLVEEIRKQVASLERREWRIKFPGSKPTLEHLAMRWPIDYQKKRHDVEARGTCSPGFQKAHYIKKPEKKPGTNDSESGQRAKKLRQPDNTFPQSKIDQDPK